MTYKKIRARETYFPPFVNERFDGPPFWACTFAALLNGANVGFLGKKPPTHDEVRKLALASGDPTLRRGANSSEMVRAMKVRYNQPMFLESLNSARSRERLSNGWALVAGVTYGRIPDPWRRHASKFKGGHRITLIGWDDNETWILDPMAPNGNDWLGERIPWRVIERAWWPGEQLWFAEGMFRTPPKVTVHEKVPHGRWSLPKGARLVLRKADNPRVVMRKFIVGETKSGHFKELVELFRKDGTSMGLHIRISAAGKNNGMLIPVTKSLTLNPRPASSGGQQQKTAPKPDSKKSAPDAQSPDFLAGRRAEYKRIENEIGAVVRLPPAP